MPGLVPGIHVFFGGGRKPWMAGTSPHDEFARQKKFKSCA